MLQICLNKQQNKYKKIDSRTFSLRPSTVPIILNNDIIPQQPATRYLSTYLNNKLI